MKSPGLLIAAVILAALSGFLYWSNRHKPTEEDNGPMKVKEVASSPKILAFNHDDIVQFTLRRKGEPTVDLSKDQSGVWQITAPKPLPADQDAVSTLLTTFSSVKADRLVDDKPSDLKPFGLTPASLELDATLKDKKTQKLYIGDQTATGNDFYVMLAGDPRLFIVAGYTKSSLDKSAPDLRDKRLLTADFDKVSQIELLNSSPANKNDITLARNKDSWQILKPKPARADSSKVEDLIRALKDVKLDTGSDETKDAAAFQSALPFSTVKLTGASGTQQLEIRKLAPKPAAKKPGSKKEKNAPVSRDADSTASSADYYARSSVVSGVYKIPATTAAPLDKSLDDFHDKRLFDFGFADPDKIEIQDSGKSYFLTRSGSDWWGPDGKKLDPATVQPLLDGVRDLSASKFPDSGFTVSTLDITAISNNKQRTEKVLVSKSGDHFIAKRESEPALYEIPASAISDLQKSAAALKPLAPPPPAKK